MTQRLSEAERRQKYNYYVTDSPLKTNTINRGIMKKDVSAEAMKKKTLDKLDKLKKRERNFVLDGVYEHVHKSSVVPTYNAFLDPHARSYFRQPGNQGIMRRSVEKDGQIILPSITTYKLSTRRRIPQTPVHFSLEERENRFNIDCVRADSLKSPRKPVIPIYDALYDRHAQHYFKKKSVRNLLQKTCNIYM